MYRSSAFQLKNQNLPRPQNPRFLTCTTLTEGTKPSFCNKMTFTLVSKRGFCNQIILTELSIALRETK